MAAVVAATPEVLVAYGKHKFRFSVEEDAPTCATVVRILVRDHVRVPASWCTRHRTTRINHVRSADKFVASV